MWVGEQVLMAKLLVVRWQRKYQSELLIPHLLLCHSTQNIHSFFVLAYLSMQGGIVLPGSSGHWPRGRVYTERSSVQHTHTPDDRAHTHTYA